MSIYYEPITVAELESILGTKKTKTLLKHHGAAKLNIGWNGFGKSLESIVHTLGKRYTRVIYLYYRGRFISLPQWYSPPCCN